MKYNYKTNIYYNRIEAYILYLFIYKTNFTINKQREAKSILNSFLREVQRIDYKCVAKITPNDNPCIFFLYEIDYFLSVFTLRN